MNQAERREAIKQILNARRSEKIENLAAELNVSVRTIKYDIEALACSYPIESVRGPLQRRRKTGGLVPAIAQKPLPGAGRAAEEAGANAHGRRPGCHEQHLRAVCSITRPIDLMQRNKGGRNNV